MRFEAADRAADPRQLVAYARLPLLAQSEVCAYAKAPLDRAFMRLADCGVRELRLRGKPRPARLSPQSYDCVLSHPLRIGERRRRRDPQLLQNTTPSPNKRGTAALASAPSVRRSREPMLGHFAPAAAPRYNRLDITFILPGAPVAEGPPSAFPSVDRYPARRPDAHLRAFAPPLIRLVS